MKVPPPYLPTVPGIPRSCDTSRAGSAGVDGMMNTQSARGEVTNPPARQSCNSNADGYYPVKIFMKYNRTRNHPAFSGQTYEQSRQGRPRTRDARQDARKIRCYRHRQAYSTLLRETNPLDPGAKLGVETFMAIIETTGDSTPLNVMVRELGYRLAPVD